MSKKYYKVVSRSNQSVMKAALPPEYIIKYNMDEWITPRVSGTKIMVFSTLEYAREFSAFNDKIYEVEIKNPSTKAPFIPYLNCCSYDSFKQRMAYLFKLRQCHKKYFQVANKMPSGTVFVDAVKLIQQVPNASD